MNHEIELKLSLPRSALPALRRHPLVASAQRATPTCTLINTYYDTPAQDLAAARVALRTRKQGRRWIQTVKAEARSVGGLSSRPEWETPYRGAFDFSGVDDPRTRHLLESHAEALKPLFSTDFRRETLRLVPARGIEILLMIDRGTISAGERSEPISEIELELVSGSPETLLDLAQELARSVPLRPEDDSKAQRGLRIFRGEARTPAKAGPSPVGPADAPRAAFLRIAQDCLAQWQANAAGAASDDAPEFVHQMRVALRRLRSALKLFAPVLPPDWVERWSGELADAAAELGEARDIDVLYHELLDPILADEACPPAVRALAERVASAQDEARRHVRQCVEGRRQGQRMLAFAADVYRLGTDPDTSTGALTEHARAQLDKIRKRALKRWKAAVEGHTAELHSLRITLKRLRYAVEFFAPLFAAGGIRKLQKALVQAQESLGYLNDVEVGRLRLAAWAGDDPQLQSGSAYVAGWHLALARDVERRVVPEVGALLELTPWRRRRRKKS